MESDETLLNQELHWTPGSDRARRERRPAGANVMTAIGVALTLVLWAITAVLLTPFLDSPSGSGMIDPRSIVALFVFGIEAFVAAGLSGRVWVALGPKARGVLRAIGVLGPWPTLFITFFVVLVVVSPFVAPFLPNEPKPDSSGSNWYFARDARQQANYENAVTQCGQNGGRVPSREDLELFDPPFPRGIVVWLEKPEDSDQLVALDAEGRAARTSYASHAGVVCFRP